MKLNSATMTSKWNTTTGKGALYFLLALSSVTQCFALLPESALLDPVFDSDHLQPVSRHRRLLFGGMLGHNANSFKQGDHKTTVGGGFTFLGIPIGGRLTFATSSGHPPPRGRKIEDLKQTTEYEKRGFDTVGKLLGTSFGINFGVATSNAKTEGVLGPPGAYPEIRIFTPLEDEYFLE